MRSLPANIYSVDAVREIDRVAIETGTQGYTLMKRAGLAALLEARAHFPGASRWQVVCGAGNNAGDGYVVARLAAQDGIAISVVTLVDPETLTGDAATAYADFAAEGGVVLRWNGELDAEAELLIDAILGSGLKRDVGGEFAAAVAAVNAHSANVHAMDIATGVHGDTGAVMGSAVVADLTTTFVGLKAGLFLGEGPNHCGTITFDGLDIDESCLTRVTPVMRRLTDQDIRDALPKRKRSAHKGDFGHVLVVGGGSGMPGAARLCGEAALRSGAGRVTIATHPDNAASITAACPELMAYGISSKKALTPFCEMADVVAFGPGLGQSDWAKSVYEVISALGIPAIWDADALNLLASAPNSAENRIITPHPGEAARLLGVSAADIQADRPSALSSLVDTLGGTAVLKGAGTLISVETGVPYVCTSGNPGMAAPGMGDVLCGVIAAMVAEGLPLASAARVGVELHARAGDIAARDAERGMLASDLFPALREVVNP